MVFFPQDDEMITRGYFLVVAAAGLWGTLGLVFRILHDDYLLSSLAIAFLRAALAFIILVAFLLFTHPQRLKLDPRALPFFALYGFCGVTAFYFFYTQAAIQTTVTTAVVLLYTAPAFVTLIAWRIWGEPLGARKLFALVLAFPGCALVARAYDPAQVSLNLLGLAMGMAAGFAYALYTLFSKFALTRYASPTALLYALLFGALFLIPFQTLDGFAPLVSRPRVWLLLLLLAVGPTLVALAWYNSGLRRVPASNASLVATIEPVVASLLAFSFLGERLELLQMVGGAMVIAGAVGLGLDGSKDKSN
jgi:DME family drug/metabolite transporter